MRLPFPSLLKMSLACALLIGARSQQAKVQTTRHQRPAPVQSVANARDTLRVLVPPPAVVINESSQLPVVVVGVLTLVVLVVQVLVMRQQSQAMDKQTTLFDRQTKILEQQANWRRDQAIGTFYRMAFDLVDELGKANVSDLTAIPANYEAHPRQVLRRASDEFAPLGNPFIMAVNQAAMRLDDYFTEVQAYNAPFRGQVNRDTTSLEDRGRYNSVQSLRGIMGNDLDLANRQIPAELRWKYSDGTEYNFRRLCSKPAPRREA